MSIGTPHKHGANHREKGEFQKLTSEPSFQRMWARPFRVDTSKQVPDTAGYNVAGSVFYIDTDFAAAVRAGKVTVEGMTPAQIMHAIVLHERIEKCLLDSANDIDDYGAAHEFATLAEHLYVISIGAKPRLYEAALHDWIEHNEKKPLKNVPLDLDCEPYVDHPDQLDLVAISAMSKLGVEDAGKTSKDDVKYGKSTGPDRCAGCANWMAWPQAELSPCKIIAGAVRGDRWCTKFEGNKNGQPSSSGRQAT